MELKRKNASKIPITGLWVIVAYTIYAQANSLPHLMLMDLPGRAALLILGLIALALLVYLLEKVFPRREVLYCKFSGPDLIIAPGGRKLFRLKIKVADIDQIRIGKRKFLGAELYIFLKDGTVKTFADGVDQLERLVGFISEQNRSITIKR